MEKNNSLLIMAAGASSRMKQSLESSSLGPSVKNKAQKLHKSLIPLGPKGEPLLYYLINNAYQAGYNSIYLITSEENQSFKEYLNQWKQQGYFTAIKFYFAPQSIPEGREKPLGTADAVQQALMQYPELRKTTFTVCNGDNLYSSHVFERLATPRNAPHALISYARSGLRFSDERISKFAVMHIDSSGFLKEIIEKPDPSEVEQYRDKSGELRVSMNIFSFNGGLLYPYLVKCPLHPKRDEKELPEALRLLNQAAPQQVVCLPVKEHLPDLTSAEDISIFSKEL
ncbi:MAG: sugar phosphate nucleotidyltransferase [Flavobacteriaceae bacterium]